MAKEIASFVVYKKQTKHDEAVKQTPGNSESAFDIGLDGREEGVQPPTALTYHIHLQHINPAKTT
jgi:hypothetical protein